MTELSIKTSPPPYTVDSIEEEKDKPLLPSSPFPSPTSTAASPTYNDKDKVVDHGDFETLPVVHCASGTHDTALAPRERAIRVGITMANPCLGLMIALCPKGRRRTCRACGAVVTVPKKKALC